MSASTWLTALALALAPVVCQPASAQEDWMSEADLARTFAGKTITGRYASGRPFTEQYREDGRLEYRERGTVIAGKWAVEAGAFCTIYDQDASGGCYRVRRLTGNCYEFYFVARTQRDAADKPRRPDWTARGSIEGEKGACQDELAA